MIKNNKDLVEENEHLSAENKLLAHQLHQAKATIEAIKAGNVDALVIAGHKTKKIFTEQNSDNIYRVLIEKMNEAAITLDRKGTILYCNAYFARMLDLPLKNTIGKRIDEFVDDSSKDKIEQLLKLNPANPVKEEAYLLGKNGMSIPVLISVNELVLDNYSVISVILTDLSIQHKFKKELEERARQLEKTNSDLESANKDLTSFTYVSSHDLQEPLRKIQNFASCIMLEDGMNMSEKGKYYFQRMEQSAKRMQALIDDLLTYSHTKNSERTLVDTDICKIIDEIKADYENTVDEKVVSIASGRTWHLKVIPFQIKQLFQNLISNSVKFSKPGTSTEIIINMEMVEGSSTSQFHLSPSTNYCHIKYIDNGIGFDPGYNDYIFEVFKRLHSKEEYEGTGIGLAICRRIVENHQGLITAQGELNKGARFDIYIPA